MKFKPAAVRCYSFAPMKPQRKYLIWISDDAARAFLGVDSGDSPSRWAVVGEYIEGDEGGHGIWVNVYLVNEWRPTANGVEQISWKVTPSECLILWNFVISAQALDDFSQAKTAGFKQT